MSSADGSGSRDREPFHSRTIRSPEDGTDTLLVETLLHLLIEKGLLTKNDALSVVQTVAEVQQGRLDEGHKAGTVSELDIDMLRRMYDSFEMLEGRAPDKAEGSNIYPLRPPLHDDHPAFPADD